MPAVLIEGAGIAGQVLHRELTKNGVPSRLVDNAVFPREKVCGGAMQWDSWQYLRSVFDLPQEVRLIRRIRHFWRGKPLSSVALDPPMVYAPRFFLDDALFSQQNISDIPAEGCLRVAAAGIESRGGDWLGFQGQTRPAEDLEMHYGRGIYLGIAPTLEGQGHVALIVKKSAFRNAEGLRRLVREELDLEVEGPLKGTRSLRYHAPAKKELAVGDAMLATHPFLGLGMKHAILSARLMARCILSGRTDDYADAHRRLFGKYRRASWAAGTLYDSPLRFVLKPWLGSPRLFLRSYRWLHGQEEILKALIS